MEKETIVIIGAGSWGTTLAALAAENGHTTILWARRQQIVDDINTYHENSQYLKGHKLPQSLVATTDVTAVKDATLIIFATPSGYLREIAQKFQAIVTQKAIILHVIKGIEDSGKLMSQVLHESFPQNRIAVLSGPNHAEEVARKLPTATVIASRHDDVAQRLCSCFAAPYFKTFPHDDVAGIELCGAIKNIVAIAIGVCDGLKLGDNAKASIMTLGLSEMSRVSRQLGARSATSFGLAGVGDLIATCYSNHSRNRFVGEQLAAGRPLEQIQEEMHGMIAEGIRNTKLIYGLCKSKGIEPTLITHAHKVLYQGMDLKQAMEELLADISLY